MNGLDKTRTKEDVGMNDVQYNLLTGLEMYLTQVDRLNGRNIHASGYKEEVEEQAMGMYKLVEDIVGGGVDAPEPTIDDPLGLVRKVEISR